MTAIILDLDGTLVDTEGIMRRATRKAFMHFGTNPSNAEMIKYLGQGSKRYVYNIARPYGLSKYIPQILDERIKQYFKLAKGKLKPYKGVKYFLRKAKKAKLPIAVATSGIKKKMFFSFKETNIDPKYFKATVTADDVKEAKPDPQIYLKTARKLKVKPSECIVIEDAPAGIVSAKRAGMKVIAVSNSFPQYKLKKYHPDLVVSNINDPKVWRFIYHN